MAEQPSLPQLTFEKSSDYHNQRITYSIPYDIYLTTMFPYYVRLPLADTKQYIDAITTYAGSKILNFAVVDSNDFQATYFFISNNSYIYLQSIFNPTDPPLLEVDLGLNANAGLNLDKLKKIL